MTMRFSFLAQVVLLVLTLGAARVQSAPGAISVNAFDEANRLYEQGKFTEAAAAYEKLTQSGQTSAALCYNLGNAYFKAGEIGRSIVAYRQAEQLSPRDPDLRANLRFARQQVRGPTLPPAAWQRQLARLSLNEWTLLTAGSAWLWLLLLASLQWRPSLQPALRRYAIALGLVTALLGGLLGAALYDARWCRTAVVVGREAQVRQAPVAESPGIFTVHDGSELRIVDQKDDWLQVTSDPRRIGWIERSRVAVLPPS